MEKSSLISDGSLNQSRFFHEYLLYSLYRIRDVRQNREAVPVMPGMKV